MRPKISIIVPVYNVSKYLRKCLESLLNQTLKEIEIICIDDGSTDDSRKILKEYKEKDSRIKVIEKENGGRSSTRNAGLAASRADYIMFCDGDDFFSREACEKMLKALEKDDSDLAVCGMEIVYLAHSEMRESDRKYYRLEYNGKKYINDDIILKTDASVCNKIFRSKIIKENDLTFPEGVNNEDYYFYNAYMSVSETATFLNKKLYNYVRHENSIMSDNFEKDRLSIDHLIVAEKLFDFYKKNNFLKKHTDLFWRQWIDSYWFSTNYSSKNHQKEISLRAKTFANKNLEKYPPENESLLREVKEIANYNILAKIKKRARKAAVNLYKKTHINYRQQRFANDHIEELQKRIKDLSNRLDNLKEENEKQ